MNTVRVFPSPTLRRTSRWLLSVGFLLALATQVFAGGEIITTVQDGNWADPATWDLHIPSAENGDQAVVVHDVDVTDGASETSGLAVGAAAGAGVIDITSGSLVAFEVAEIGTGGNPGTVNVAGGAFELGFDLTVGSLSSGELNVTSGLVLVGANGGDLRVGTDGFPGVVTVEGADATFDVSGSLRFGANSTLVVRPTGNGPSGLTTIESTGTQFIDAVGSTLVLDFSLYEPAVGDSWEIVRFAPESSVDQFANIITPDHITVEQVNETAESITIRVTDVRILTKATDGLFEGGVRVTWSRPSSLQYIHRVLRIDPAEQDTVLLSKIAATDTLYFDTTGLPDKVYTYCVERGIQNDPAFPYEIGCDDGFRKIFAPVQVKASDGTYSDQVRVTWIDRSTVEAGFAIYRGNQGDVDLPLLDMVDANVQLYQDTSAEQGVAYDYEVRAFDDASFESAGNRDTGVRGFILPPGHVAATDGIYADKVVVTWNDVTEEEYGFRIYRDDVLLASVGEDETTYADLTGLGVQHEYAVVSVLRSIVDADTSFVESEPALDLGIGGPGTLARPAGVMASDLEFDDRVKITWTDSVPNESGFEIRRDGELIGEVAANTTRFDDFDVAPALDAVYCVTAVSDSGGTSVPVCDNGTRAWVVPVTNVQATDGEFETFVRLTWESESTTAVLFKILQNGFVRKTLSAGYRSCEIGQEVPTGQEAQYCVVAVTPLGQEAASDCDTGFRTLLPPSDVAATDSAFEDRTLVTWTDNSAAEGGYRILRDSVENGSGPEEIGQVPANREAFIDDQTAQAGEVYQYFVAAMDATYPTSFFDSEMDSDTGSRRLNPPTQAAASQGEYEDRIVVTWKDNSFAESSYAIFRDDVFLESIPANSIEYEDTTVDFGATHQYAIRASDSHGSSEPALTSGFTEIQSPGSVSASDDYESYVSLVWTDDSVVESGYLITRDGVELTTTAPNQTVYTDNTGPAGQEVEYCVYAVRGAQRSEPGCDLGTNFIATDDFDASTDRIKARTPTSIGFGSEVAVDGDWALIGAEALVNPSAHMFKRSADGTWVEKQVWRGSNLQGFGSSVAIDGDFAFIGADKNDAVGPDAGRVQVLKRSGDTWQDHQELFASNATTLNLFGSGLAVDGDVLAVSGESDVWVFERDPSTDLWSEVRRLGTSADLSGGIPSLAMDGNTIVAGNTHDAAQGVDAGAVHVFARQYNGWQFQQSLRASDGAANRIFGVTLDTNGDRIVAGNNINGTDGSLYVFEFGNGTWTETDQIDPPQGVTNRVALGDDYLLARLINGPFGLQYPVDVYFHDPDDGWLRGKRLRSDLTGDNLDNFGEAMFIGDGITLIGRADNSVYPVKTTAAPGRVAASDGAYDNRVRIEWIDQSDREDGYRIYRDGQLIATTGPNTDSYNDFDAVPGRTHQYGVATWAGNFESVARPDYGWMEPDGTIAGNVSTRAGAAVENVEVCLEPSPGRSFLFDGDMGRLEVAKAHMPAAEFTLEFWFRTSSPLGTIFQYSTENYPEAVVIDNVGTDLRVKLNGAAQLYGDYGLDDGAWHHVAFGWIRGSAVKFYLDGAFIGNFAGHGSPTIETDGVLYLGGNPGSTHHLGQIDEVRIWNKQRTNAQIADHYLSRLTGDETGLVSYWPMDEGSGTATADLGSYRQNAVRSGGAYWAENGGAPIQVCGLTDIEGNYTISRLHYGEATTFQVIPKLGERTFDPAFKAITLDEETPIQNEIGFLDITSFALAGNLTLEGYDGCVVEGVQILVDGEFAGVSDPEGNFTIAAQPGTRVITPVLEGRTFTPTSRTYEVSEDIGGIEFRDTTERALSGRVGGGCDLAIGTVTLEIAAENGCLDPIQVDTGSDYEILLPAQRYLVRVSDVQNVPSALDRADILAFFENLGAVAVDLTTEDQTQNFTYRAPVTIAITGLPTPTCDGQLLTDPETGVSFPAVPVIAQGDSAVVTIKVYEDYGNGNTCPVDSALVTIFDEVQDIEDDPVTVTVVGGVASYTVRGNTPNTNPGRIDSAGNDRSYQKPLTAFAEIPGLDPVQTTEWVIVTGSKPRTGTFVTATSDEFPILILRDPPGDASASYYSQGHTTQTVFSGSILENLSGTITNEVKAGITFDKGTPFFTTETKGVLTTKYGIEIGIQVGIGGELVFTTSTTETFATSANDVVVGQGGDVYLGVGLNLIFAKSDDLGVDPSTCTIQRTQSVRFGGAENAFNTVYLFTENHIRNVVIPQLEDLATLDPDSAVVFRSNISSWQRQLARNQALKDRASFVENRSFSAGADFEFETTTVRDTTVTGTIGIFAKSELALEFDFTESGSGSKTTFGANWGFEEAATVTSTESGALTVGYNLSDDDIGDYFSVDIYHDPYYKTPVFKLRSGRSSCPWEPGTQPRDSVSVAVEPPIQVGVPANEAAAFTLSITNDSPSGELREYTIVPVTASNPYGAKLNLDGSGFPTERSIFVDAFPNNVQTLTLTVERGPNRYFYEDIKLLVVPPCELANFRNGGALQFADTLSFSVSFDAPCSDVTLFQPKPDWRFNKANSEATDDTLTITLKDFEFAISEFDSIESVGAEYRKIGTENWFPIGDEIPRSDLPVLNNGSPGSVTLPWDVSVLPDGQYQIRAFTRCDLRGFSTVASGRIDRQSPLVFGDPEPADLVLALGDQISIDFNEPIDCTSVTSARVSLVVDATSEPVIFDLQCDGDRILLDAADSELNLLEGQTLRARVEGIRDLAGNSLVSPRSWTFEVRRSEFVWANSHVTREAPYRSPGNVTARLVNGTDANQTYELIDLPAWLSSAQAQGSVGAGQELALALAIDPSLAIGSYQATLNAAVPDSATAQFLIPLDVQVNIVCAPPTWVFQPSDYEYTMTAVLHVTVNDVPTADSTDVVAAFVGNQIRGVGSPIYVPEVDSWLVFMNVHANIPVGENVRFRVYDSSDCRTYNSASNYLRFEADRRRGTPELPILLAAEDAPPQDVQLVSLGEGWTWFSLNRIALDMSVFSVLADLNPSEGDLIKSQFDGFAVFDPTVGWVGSLTELDVRSSYAIHLSDAGTLRHEGMAADPMIPIPVVDGWNWIGYPLPGTELVGTALGSLSNADGDVIKSQLFFSHFKEGDGAWLGGLPSMAPGFGYRLYLDDAFLAAGGPTFQYQGGAPLMARDGLSGTLGIVASGDADPVVLVLRPDELETMGESGESTEFTESTDLDERADFAHRSGLAENRPEWEMDFGYQHDMSVITLVELDGSDYDVSGALLAAFVGDELRGVTELRNVGLDRYYAFLTVHSDVAEGETVRFELYDPELDQVVDVDENVTFRVDQVSGSLRDPLLVHATSSPITPDGSALTYSLASHYPNPVVASDVHIRWSIPTQERVVLGVYDIQGREVQRVVDGVMEAGNYVQQLDADRYSSGVYFYRIQAGDFAKVRRVLIVH